MRTAIDPLSRFNESWADVTDYKSGSIDIRRYYDPADQEVQADGFLTSLYFRFLSTSDNIEKQEIWELLSEYWIECFQYVDQKGQKRCRVVFIRKDTKLYHMNVMYRRLVDFCYQQKYVLKGLPFIGAHNYTEMKRMIANF